VTAVWSSNAQSVFPVVCNFALFRLNGVFACGESRAFPKCWVCMSAGAGTPMVQGGPAARLHGTQHTAHGHAGMPSDTNLTCASNASSLHTLCFQTWIIAMRFDRDIQPNPGVFCRHAA
jgi:hypothetical protein